MKNFSTMKKLLALALSTAMLLAVMTGCGKKEASLSEEKIINYDMPAEGEKIVELNIKDYGTVKIRLFAEECPKAVENFLGLVEQKYYDELIFHRVVKDFVIQGGDPKGNGTGGSGTNIKGEFSANGVANNLSHKRGVISMARAMAPDSASSQFFICHADSVFLDGNYAAFGKVTEGMDVVDAIASVATDSNDKPLQEQKIKSIRITGR